MQISTTNKSNKKKIAIAILSLLLLSSGVVLAFYMSRTQDRTESIDTSTKEEATSEETSRQDAIDKQEFLEKEAANNDEQYQPAKIENSDLTVSAEESGSSLVILTSIKKFSGTGSCTVRLSRGASVITKTTEVLYQREASSCAGFSIPLSDLELGTWNIDLTISTQSSNLSKSITYTIK